MGVVTAVFGGVLRDVVCNEIPTPSRSPALRRMPASPAAGCWWARWRWSLPQGQRGARRGGHGNRPARCYCSPIGGSMVRARSRAAEPPVAPIVLPGGVSALRSQPARSRNRCRRRLPCGDQNKPVVKTLPCIGQPRSRWSPPPRLALADPIGAAAGATAGVICVQEKHSVAAPLSGPRLFPAELRVPGFFEQADAGTNDGGRPRRRHAEAAERAGRRRKKLGEASPPAAAAARSCARDHQTSWSMRCQPTARRRGRGVPGE